MSIISSGKIVTGTVVQVKDNEALIDVGYKMEGTIYKDHFTANKIASLLDVIKVGDKIKVKIVKAGDQSLLLSRIDIEAQEKRDKIIKKIISHKPFMAKVKKHVEGGYLLDKDDVELFMPDNYVDLEKDFDGSSIIGTEQKVMFVSSSQEKNGTKFTVSRKQVQYREQKQKRENEFESISVGDELEGIVVRLADFGAFVKFDEVEGLVHLSEISHYHIKTPDEILSIGDAVKVLVIKKTEAKLQLSIKALQKTPWDSFVETHKVGDIIDCKIVKKSDSWMLCEAERDVVGILNKADYSWNPEENFAGTINEGDIVKLQITYIDKDKNRMTLSKKHLEYNPWQDVHFRLHEIVTGSVLRFTNTGAIVKVGNVEGFLSNKEASDTLKPASEVLKVGEVIKCEVLRVDPRNWYLSLSIRSIEEKKNREIVDKYMEENVSSSSTLKELLEEKDR